MTPAILAVYESLGIRGVRLEIVGSVRAREASEESDLDITAKHPDHTWKTLMPGADIVEELFNNELEV